MTEPADQRPSFDSPLLDNLAWYALADRQSELAQWSDNGRAVRYHHKVSPICAVDRIDDDAWQGLDQLAGPKGYISLFRDDLAPPPDDWKSVFSEPVSQYVADELPPPPPELDIIELGAADADEMVALTKLTEPGPFSAQTYRTGRYFGLRREGRLVAMAGQRMWAEGWGEVSAVCVHPDALREGLGAAMTLAAAAAITERGDRATLHVRHNNDAAHCLYLKLGFELRRQIKVGIFRAPR